MGQAHSDALGDAPPPQRRGLDPGPLSDAELVAATELFARHATDGVLAQGAFDALAAQRRHAGDDFAAAERHTSFYDAARNGAPTVDAQAFVGFCGTAARGSRSRRLEHVVTAGLGVGTLGDVCDETQTTRLAALMFALVGVTGAATALADALAGCADAAACARWCDRNAPGLADVYAAWARRRFLNDPRPALTLPTAGGLLEPASIRACLLLSDARTFGGLRPLYASSKDGWSFQRLCREILGWTGPTLVVARAGSRVFGVLADEAWRDDRKPFGASGCRLYTFAPAFAVARPRAGHADPLYLNTRGSQSVTKGLVVGGGALHIPMELGDARVKVGRSLAFESLALVDDATVRQAGGWVDLDELEVWAVGDESALAAAAAGRARAQGLRADHIAWARKVDKAAFLNEFDRETLLGKTFVTGADRGRT